MRAVACRCGIAAFTLMVSGCVTVPPEEKALRALLWDAATECKSRFATIVTINGIDNFGRLNFTYTEAGRENQAFLACYEERVRIKTATLPIASGRVATATAPTDGKTAVVINVTGNSILVPATLNDQHRATLLFDTGSTATILSPALLQRAGVTVPLTAPRRMMTVVGGRMLHMPVIQVRSLGVGAFTIEDVEVLAYDALPAKPGIDGILGTNILNHFRFAIDRGSRRLTLELVGHRPPATVDSTIAPAMAPRWTIGDEWRFRWTSATGQGTFTWRVSAEEVVDGVRYYVVRAASGHRYYRTDDLGWHMDVVDGAVARRAVPAFGFRWPLEHGRVWEITYHWEDVRSGTREDRYRRCAVEAPERIAVPAGTFLTHHIVCRDDTGRITTESWYAPSVKHWVKQVSPGTNERVREMTSFAIR